MKTATITWITYNNYGTMLQAYALQSYIKELRGAGAYEHIQELLQKGLISRTKDKNGRSFNIKTTPKFAEYLVKRDFKKTRKSRADCF